MAHSLCNATFTAALADTITILSNRRNYAITATSIRVGRKTVVDLKAVKVVREATSSWVPDPVTGCYRPANRLVEVDVAELRELLLSHKYRNRGTDDRSEADGLDFVIGYLLDRNLKV